MLGRLFVAIVSIFLFILAMLLFARQAAANPIAEHELKEIVRVAQSMGPLEVERAATIIAVKKENVITYRVEFGDHKYQETNSADLPMFVLAQNERIVADVHNHIRYITDDGDTRTAAKLRKATVANNYPGPGDFSALVRRGGAPSAIITPSGRVLLLTLYAGAPVVTTIHGTPLTAPTETEVKNLGLEYLAQQNYIWR